MNMQTAGRTLALAILLATTGVAAAGDDRDPENGQSWLTKSSVHEVREGLMLSGTLRATDDYGATHERDFRLSATGSIGREDRKVVLNRFEPECFELAPAARLSLEDYCDQITLTWRDGDAEIAFSSLDANRRYSFTLRADSHSPNEWTSLSPGVPAPKLRVTTSADGNDVGYRMELVSEDASYSQSGELTADQLRGIELHPLEASLVGLSDVLMTFNRYAFERAILPRDDPEYRPTPYSLWAEETTEGGCIFTFCFGNLGGNGPGAGNNSNNTCKPGGAGYNTLLCPYDITFAKWPIAARPKLQKIDNDNVRFLIFAKNVGPGLALVQQSPTFAVFTAHASLVRIGSGTPLVTFSDVPTPSGECFKLASNAMHFEILSPFSIVDLDAGEFQSMGLTNMRCSDASGRPAGRYRLHIEMDPMEAVDYPGNAGNNVGTSGPLEWVHLRD